MAEAVPIIRTKKSSLLTFLEFILQSCELGDIAESGFFNVAIDLLDSLLCGLGFGSGLFGFNLGVSAGMADENPAGAATELNNLERKFVAYNGGLAVFHYEVAGEAEALGAVFEGDCSALVANSGNGTFNNAAGRIFGLELIPRVREKLLVTEAELVVGLIEVEDDNVHLVAGLNHLAGMFDLVPGKVADMYKTFDSVFEFSEYAEGGDVTDGSGLMAADGIALADVLPRVGNELLQTEGHLAGLAVEGKNLCLNFVADLEEVLGDAETGAPAHLGNVDKTLNAGHNLYECTVVGDENDFTLDFVANLEVGIKSLPRMCGKLLETEGDSLLLLVEVEDDDLDLLIESNNLFGIADTAPGEVGDVDETVHAAEVDEYAVVGDILDGTFENLALFKLADDFALLLLEFSLEESLMGNDDVAELLIDLDNLEVHGLVDECIVVTDRLDVDLGTGEEGLDTEYVDDHTTLGAGLDITLDDLAALKCGIDHIPRTELTGLLVGKDELALAVLCGLNVNFYFVAYLEVGVVTELGSGDDAFALVTDVDDDLSLGDGGDGTLNDVILDDLGEGLVVSGLDFGFVLAAIEVSAAFEFVPVELIGSYGSVELRFLGFFVFDFF